MSLTFFNALHRRGRWRRDAFQAPDVVWEGLEAAGGALDAVDVQAGGFGGAPVLLGVIAGVDSFLREDPERG